MQLLLFQVVIHSSRKFTGCEFIVRGAIARLCPGPCRLV